MLIHTCKYLSKPAPLLPCGQRQCKAALSKKKLNAPSPLLVATQCRVCFVDAVHSYSWVDYVNMHMFRWPAPAAIWVLWWKMCSCPIWRQTSQSSDTLKSPQPVCVSFSLCVCVCILPWLCEHCSYIQWSKVLCCWQSCPLHERSQQWECSGPSSPSLIQRYSNQCICFLFSISIDSKVWANYSILNRCL